jgi:putative DNA primase/helicase
MDFAASLMNLADPRNPTSLANARGLLSANRIKSVMQLARSELLADASNFDTNADVVGCQNGVLSLAKGDLIQTEPSIMTKRLGCNFEPDAECASFKDFLDTIFDGDEDVISFVQRVVGYSLSGSTTEQCLFVLIGDGANGKTTLINVLQRLFGDYAASTPMQTLMVSRYGGQQTNDLAALVGKRFVAASEGEVGQTIAESKVKMMTGGDRIACRHLYGNQFEYDPQFKLWLATNDLPRITGTGEAIWRRFHVIKFPVTIPPDQRDGDLGKKLGAELSGILNWALEGNRDWKSQGLNPPGKVIDGTQAYRSENDTTRQFVETCCELDPKACERTSKLFEAYENWTRKSGLEALSI